MDFDTDGSLLGTFVGLASDPDTAKNVVLKCGKEKWTYSELHAISSGIALDLGRKYGLRPVVAVVSENHPYILAITLAVWKLGGIIAPLDHHAPPNLMEGMLRNIRPICVVCPSSDKATQSLAKGSSCPAYCIYLNGRTDHD